jgi:hypothetical protein
MRRRPLTPGEHPSALDCTGQTESRTSTWWQVSWLPDHSTPGPSHTADPSPWSPDDDHRRRIGASVQWLPGFVPGYSGGGRAGFSPASLSTRARLT